MFYLLNSLAAMTVTKQYLSYIGHMKLLLLSTFIFMSKVVNLYKVCFNIEFCSH